MEKERNKNGRPTKFTKELAAEICERISEGEPLAQICRDSHMPARRTIYLWMTNDTEEGRELNAHIARAREAGYDQIADETLEIADDPDEDVQRSRLRVDTRLKLLAKWNPKKYGDKLDVTSGGDKIDYTRIVIENRVAGDSPEISGE